MPSPPISVFLTTIASQPALRQRQEYVLRILQVKKIPFTSYDLASDESAKRLWKRKAPLDKQQLPGILVGGQFPGTFSEFEDAVEYGELDTFLRLNETWKEDEDQPVIPAKPIGVPGAVTPLQMTPDHLKKKILAQPPSSPLRGKSIPVNKREGEFDVSTELEGYGLQGVKVTEEELRNLVAELGLDGDDAGDLVKGLSGDSSSKTESQVTTAQAQESNGAKEKTEAAEAESHPDDDPDAQAAAPKDSTTSH
ncbi:putative SH3-binding, glutamic acid-rich protein [Lyophyllum shimeji]|uniref:SH3-binding, glutamic acid-rich protein n=1 Tax=Lyophyllum shimeji TaxID=47721 RepID=A0A9P3UIT5_LYOSH|nr:putative SH3-binding, glutamic acid-rich protein [Lyophyllum shimeji]